ncbi:MAG TPA: hypothetical protein EYN66_15695 [Myxococcales bacterium]|nr:hypothetical protein [Myxococcales bacterium]
MDKPHGAGQLLWAMLVALLLGSLGMGYYLLQKPTEFEPTDQPNIDEVAQFSGQMTDDDFHSKSNSS